MPTNITDTTFDAEVTNHNGITLVDFWSECCQPCKRMLPVMDEISAQHANIKVCKINIDDCTDLATRFMVRSVPMFIVFKDGKQMDAKIGGASKADMVKWAESFM